MDNLKAAHLGLRRAAVATAKEVRLLTQTRPREGFPHQQLIEALPKPDAITGAAATFAEELLESPGSSTARTLRNTTKQLVNLHASTRNLRSTVDWSSEFTGIDWWVRQRADELGMVRKHILIAPGALDQFKIEIRSRFVRQLEQLAATDGMLTDANGQLFDDFKLTLQEMERFHILTVPSTDGISPLWHPIFLGHEVAHLRYTATWVHNWLAQASEVATSDMTENLVEATKSSLQEEALGTRTLRPTWMIQLDSWLIEVACDTAAVHHYGDAAISSMSGYLWGVSDGRSSDTHPPLELRLALQSAAGSSGIDNYRPTEPFGDATSRCLDCLAVLGVSFREAVRADLDQLGTVDEAIASTVRDSAVAALRANLLPCSVEWPSGDVAAKPASIESGLVQALWESTLAADVPELTDSSSLSNRVELTSQAIDGLEFASRFESSGIRLGSHSPESATLPNILWVTPTGVMTADGEGVGKSAYDLRLGRYFIVFQRNETPFLHSLARDDIPPPVQREIEVGWGNEFTLHPGELVLAVSFESLRVSPECGAQVLSRSSLGRLGLLSATAVHVNPGFVGCLTLELVNLASVPLRLVPGQRVAQIVPAPALGATEAYDGVYQGAGRRPQFARSGSDWEAETLLDLAKDGLEADDSL